MSVGEANVIDRRSVDVLTAHWSVFYRFLLNVVDNFGVFHAIYA